MSDHSSCCSPAAKVGSSDDILSEILLRLPVRSVLRFESVSKHLHSLMSNPSFRLLHSRRSRNPPSGLLVPVNNRFRLSEFELVQFDVTNPLKSHSIKPKLTPDVTHIMIEHSCNGLMLWCCNINYYTRAYYIYNPTINQLTRLPSFTSYDEADYRQRGMTLVFDPTKSPHYRIVYAYADETGYYQIGIYSSQTRICKPSCAVSVSIGGNMKVYFNGGVYWNNAIHWLHGMGYVLYYNLDQQVVHKLQTHFHVSRIFESRDQLLLVESLESETIKFKIHELKSDYGWCLRYNVDPDEFGGSFTETMNPRSQSRFRCEVLSAVLGEKEDDSFMVLWFESWEIVPRIKHFSYVV